MRGGATMPTPPLQNARKIVRGFQQSLNGDHDPSRLISALLLCILLVVIVKLIEETGVFSRYRKPIRRREGKRGRTRSREFSRFVNEHVDLTAGMAPRLFHSLEKNEGAP